MVALKIKVLKCYFIFLRNMPRTLKNTRYHKDLLYINRKYCRCKYCVSIFAIKENNYLEKFKISPI